MNSTGNRIKQLRTLNKMSQEELGRRLGVGRAAINKYEKGTVSNIPIHAVEKMAAVLHVTPSYIVGWDTISDKDSDLLNILFEYTTMNQEGKNKLADYSHDLAKIYKK